MRRHRKVCCEIAAAARRARRRGSAAASEGATCERHGSAPCAAMAVRSRAAPVYGLALAAAIRGGGYAFAQSSTARRAGGLVKAP